MTNTTRETSSTRSFRLPRSEREEVRLPATTPKIEEYRGHHPEEPLSMMPSNDTDSDWCTRRAGYALEAGYSSTPLL
ncbi:hypothetical protein [Halalkalicoccus salilacus]|uniref:hypothetical protein n=1 Tax=Halalkalicoccus sp. GCM10025704 TaxID=3252662 RepID=UPI0036F2245F